LATPFAQDVISAVELTDRYHVRWLIEQELKRLKHESVGGAGQHA
jgi:hypothetical protein